MSVSMTSLKKLVIQNCTASATISRTCESRYPAYLTASRSASLTLPLDFDCLLREGGGAVLRPRGAASSANSSSSAGIFPNVVAAKVWIALQQRQPFTSVNMRAMPCLVVASRVRPNAVCTALHQLSTAALTPSATASSGDASPDAARIPRR